ncbi:MAG: hypothetical protein GX763_05750 [Clostridiaceae bacterium]|nr:hypothetical protein [Clostridiaceae bacterium]
MSPRKQQKKQLVPSLLMIITSLSLVVAFFLPYVTATDAAKAVLDPGEIKVSLLGMVKIHRELAATPTYKLVGTIVLVLIGLIALFTVLSALFSILKKPLPTLIFLVLNFAVFNVLNWDLTDRRVIPSSLYNWGFSYYYFYIGSVLLFVGAIWLFVVKRRAKKQLRDREAS